MIYRERIRGLHVIGSSCLGLRDFEFRRTDFVPFVQHLAKTFFGTR